jgi:two-component system, cell cycle sensor histidine kinase and response regulator CckA
MMSLFALARPPAQPGADALLAVLDAPAALVSRDGRIGAASPLWHDAFASGTLSMALDTVLPPDAVFRLCRAVRAGKAALEAAGSSSVRVDPVGQLMLVRVVNALACTAAQPGEPDGAPGGEPTPAAPEMPVAAPVFPAGSGLGALVAAAPIGLARLTGARAADARIDVANAAFTRITGGTTGMTLGDLLAETDRPLLADLKSGEEAPLALTLADGRACEAWLLADGEAAAVLVADITARRKMESRLVQSSKMEVIGKIAASVAHELNNMLGVVTLGTDQLLARHPIGDPSFEELQNVKSTSLRAANLVSTLLAYSRQQTVRREALEMGSVLSEFRVLLKKLVDERISLDFHHGRGLPPVLMDRQQLETVIMNLVTNARDAVLSKSSDGGSILVATRLASTADVRTALAGKGIADFPDIDWVEVAVTDTGTGMTPDVAAKIFDLFFTTKPKGQGTGIGMASVYGIVKGAGGFIAVETEPGIGTTFRIFLPEQREAPDLMDARPAAAVPAPAAAPGLPARHLVPEAADLSGKGRILIADDEKPLRTLTAQILRQRGYEVVEACDGEEALDILRDEEGTFDLLLSDVKMPGLDGPDLLREARPFLGRARVIFMSGYAEQNLSETLESDRQISFLQKPFDVAQLSQLVKSELAAA